VFRASLVCLLVGCATASEPEPGRAAYLAAVGKGADACMAISSDSLQGECLAFAAADLAPTDQAAAEQVCARVQHHLWRSECTFLVCDLAAVTVDQARTCCATAGEFSHRCIGHAVTRAVYAAFEPFGPGRELQAWEAGRAVAQDALGHGGFDRAKRTFVLWLLDRVDGPVLKAEHCGTAPQNLCAEVYAELVVKRAQSKGRDPASFARSACARIVTVERATQLGLPGWEPELDSAVQQAFEGMCRR
jgi:hypothetical protein